jgi:ABC-2 type transport system ATP-binding protein
MVVRTDALTKDFFSGFWRPKPHRALDGLSITIPAGGVFGLLGPNGAGKSTTLKLLIGLIRPTAGRAEILGHPPGHTTAHARMGFLPENPTFYDHLSAEELLAYFAGLCGVPAGDRQRRATAVLDRVGLGADRRRPLRQYSKGMVQRVGLAQALVNDPELVVLDEPMSGLDPIGRRDVREMIHALAGEGRTVLFSSHILSDAEELCSRVAILARGTLVASGALSELTTTETRGFEVVMAHVSPKALLDLGDRVVRMRELGAGRVSFELAATDRPEPFIATLSDRGATLVSAAAIRTTLEDVFLRALGQDGRHVSGASADR